MTAEPDNPKLKRRIRQAEANRWETKNFLTQKPYHPKDRGNTSKSAVIQIMSKTPPYMANTNNNKSTCTIIKVSYNDSLIYSNTKEALCTYFNGENKP